MTLLEGLAGQPDADQNREITLRDLRAFVPLRVAELVRDGQHAYLPRLYEFEPEAAVARLR